MLHMIRIKAGTIQVRVELNNTRTAGALLGILPVKGDGNTWGDEVYFDVPLTAEIEDGKQVVEMGDVAYWPDGRRSACSSGGRREPRR